MSHADLHPLDVMSGVVLGLLCASALACTFPAPVPPEQPTGDGGDAIAPKTPAPPTGRDGSPGEGPVEGEEGEEGDAGGFDRSRCDDLAASYVANPSPLKPPFHGTVWYSPEIIRADDPTSLVSLVPRGRGTRQMFDRRTNSFNMNEAYLFDATFGATSKVVVEVQVNTEFDLATATAHAQRYARVIGQLPAFYFRDLKTVWIHDGKELFGGGNNNFLIHTQQGEEYARDGVLEETFLHEGGHTSLDAYHARAPLWLEAQRADGGSISEYGRDHPIREDLSETIGPFLAVTYRADRIPANVRATTAKTIPNRLLYLRCQGFDMALLE